MSAVFVIILFVALFGVFKPFVSGAKRWHFGLAALVAFVLIGVTAPAPTGTNKPENAIVAPAATGSKLETAGDAETASVAPKGKWTYSSERDEMRNAETRYALLEAENTVKLDFPYGEQRGSLQIRKSPQFGFDILVGVPSGQILCHSFSNSKINVKFDDSAVTNFGCTDASDGTNNMVFIRDAQRFLAKIRASKRVVIEVEFFQNGMQQMVFESANLDWKS